MTQLVAIFKVSRPHPGATSGEITGYDENGEAIIKVKGQSIEPGTVFTMPSEAENRELIDMGAARVATADEIANGFGEIQ